MLWYINACGDTTVHCNVSCVSYMVFYENGDDQYLITIGMNEQIVIKVSIKSVIVNQMPPCKQGPLLPKEI